MRSRDWIGIALALVIGTSGLVFVFSQPDPFTTLAPQLPLLTPEDWPGSHASVGMGITTASGWEEQRGFHTTLALDGNTYASLSQSAIWYADPADATADWDKLDRASHKEEPFVTGAGGDAQPASLLFCGSAGMTLPEGFRECWYVAHWGHWYTEVNYRSQLSEDRHMQEMQKFAVLVDQLLMSATKEPCYGILCTGTQGAVKP